MTHFCLTVPINSLTIKMKVTHYFDSPLDSRHSTNYK